MATIAEPITAVCRHENGVALVAEVPERPTELPIEASTLGKYTVEMDDAGRWSFLR